MFGLEMFIPISTHSTYAPSSAHRIITCPGSLKATAGMPDITKFESFEGTVAHEIHELCLGRLCSAHEYLGSVYKHEDWEVIVDEEMADYVDESVDWCMQYEGENWQHFVERRVRIDPWTPIPDQSGTCDHAAIYTDLFGYTVLVITDLKYGKGVQVFAKRNKQLALYALGFYYEYSFYYKIDRVVIRISQPRLDHRDTWELSLDELLEFGKEIKAGFLLSTLPNAPFNPTYEACMFCKINGECKAQMELAQRIMLTVTDDLDEIEEPHWPDKSPKTALMTPLQISQTLEHKKMVCSFLEAVEDKAVGRLMHGETVLNYKLVIGKTNRQWLDPDKAVKFLATRIKDPYHKKLISPAQAEKILSREDREHLKKLWMKPTGRPTLARADDNRPEFKQSSSDICDVLEDDF